MRYAVKKFNAFAPQAQSLWEQDREKFIESVLEASQHYRAVSVKASNFMKLSAVVKALVETQESKEKKD